MKTFLHPGYFLNILNFAVIAQRDITWEVSGNYQKQSFRNRSNIANDRGFHTLSIPVKHNGKSKGRNTYDSVEIDNKYAWQRQHWRTLQTAYRTSPFFEYYEDEISTLYNREHNNLLDFNLKTIEVICDCLQIDTPTEKTSIYHKELKTDETDARFLISAKELVNVEYEPYVQVFGDRNGFIENLSILDLLFNEGTNALTYLQSISLDFLDA
ncbi:WbqC family protein [Cellulophaga baltica]|uniref:WbqC family protein n=1 Tax=Cellulophaga TaxID=104264 RepID=UPI001C07D32B|nr:MULTISPECIES: WbqC family protein [Cellulophaga]MBU2996496.1 WbqC family protein [Cellulophaga baltica]MDO6767889.1 WbqC family protein [Cellulophaga sp. 1_MG-2023]